MGKRKKKIRFYLSVPENLCRDPACRVGDGKDDGSVDCAEQDRHRRVPRVPQDQESDQRSLQKEIKNQLFSLITSIGVSYFFLLLMASML